VELYIVQPELVYLIYYRGVIGVNEYTYSLEMLRQIFRESSDKSRRAFIEDKSHPVCSACLGFPDIGSQPHATYLDDHDSRL
jgi:hypothetical protein